MFHFFLLLFPEKIHKIMCQSMAGSAGRHDVLGLSGTGRFPVTIFIFIIMQIINVKT